MLINEGCSFDVPIGLNIIFSKFYKIYPNDHLVTNDSYGSLPMDRQSMKQRTNFHTEGF